MSQEEPNLTAKAALKRLPPLSDQPGRRSSSSFSVRAGGASAFQPFSRKSTEFASTSESLVDYTGPTLIPNIPIRPATRAGTRQERESSTPHLSLSIGSPLGRISKAPTTDLELLRQVQSEEANQAEQQSYMENEDAGTALLNNFPVMPLPEGPRRQRKDNVHKMDAVIKEDYSNFNHWYQKMKDKIEMKRIEVSGRRARNSIKSKDSELNLPNTVNTPTSPPQQEQKRPIYKFGGVIPSVHVVDEVLQQRL
ncbi:hypothetical protein PROFUN_04450 [Planoprotostelium fungivorum]|uniref:Uncharacterized protein n=1 Tax=Planoprotostelium fungivorum TaxID=1890364 RepID=A0A2P6NVM9_9EUKA|nr:hypothetical protein PROFUN_04450 [Planoprotostelium fungivorum]